MAPLVGHTACASTWCHSEVVQYGWYDSGPSILTPEQIADDPVDIGNLRPSLSIGQPGFLCSRPTTVAVALASTSAVVAAVSEGQFSACVQIGNGLPCERSCTTVEAFGKNDISCLSVDNQANDKSGFAEASEIIIGAGTARGYVSFVDLRVTAECRPFVDEVTDDSDCSQGVSDVSIQFKRNCRTTWKAHNSVFAGNSNERGVCALAIDGNTAITGAVVSDASVWQFSRQPPLAADCASIDRIDPFNFAAHASRTHARKMPGVHGGAVTAVAVSERGQSQWVAATGGQDGVLKYSSSNSVEPVLFQTSCALVRRMQRAQPFVISEVVLDCDNQRILSAHGGCFAKIWDIAANKSTRRLVHRFKGTVVDADKSALVVAFDRGDSPQHIVSGAFNGSWNLWDIRVGDRNPVRECLLAHNASIMAIAICGTRILTAAEDGNAVLWDLRQAPDSSEKNEVAAELHADRKTGRLWTSQLVRPRQQKREVFDIDTFAGKPRAWWSLACDCGDDGF